MPATVKHEQLGVYLHVKKTHPGDELPTRYKDKLIDAEHPDFAIIWRQLIELRATVKNFPPGLLTCVGCEDGGCKRIPSMMPVARNGAPHFRHFSEKEYRESGGMSPWHRGAQEYVAANAEREGLTAEIEYRRARARRRIDVRVSGGKIPVAVEDQFSGSSITEEAVAGRVAADLKHGDQPVWFTNDPNGPMSIMKKAPWLRGAAHKDWLPGISERLTGGFAVAERIPCHYLPPTEKCPTTKSFRRCSRTHLHWTTARGARNLGDTVNGVAMGLIVPITYRASGALQRRFVTAADAASWQNEQDGDEEQDEKEKPSDRYSRPETKCQAELVPNRPRLELPPAPPAPVRCAGGYPQCTAALCEQRRSPACHKAARPTPPARCTAGRVHCGKPARLYPEGWCCTDHITGSRYYRKAAA